MKGFNQHSLFHTETFQDPATSKISGFRGSLEKTSCKLPSARPRIALYSPGMVGLGHIRRNLLIAQTFAQLPDRPIILLLAEAREASAFSLPTGVDCLTLPALRKDFDGNLQARYLDISLQELISLRAKVIRSAIEAFDPEVLIVDHLARGAFNELDSTLHFLRSKTETQCVLGFRDVLGDPETVRRDWETNKTLSAIQDYFEQIWVYGDPSIYDVVKEYNLPKSLAEKIKYSGYFDQNARLQFVAFNHLDPLEEIGLSPAPRLALCMVGGGQDGFKLVEAFSKADLPSDMNGVIVTGPFMSSDSIQSIANQINAKPRVRLLQFVKEPALLLLRASHVVSMGGYNTVSEILSFQKRALIVPRVRKAPEQLIRAQRLEKIGLLHLLHPDELTPQEITDWLKFDSVPKPRTPNQIDLNGLRRLPTMLQSLLPTIRSFHDRRLTR